MLYTITSLAGYPIQILHTVVSPCRLFIGKSFPYILSRASGAGSPTNRPAGDKTRDQRSFGPSTGGPEKNEFHTWFALFLLRQGEPGTSQYHVFRCTVYMKNKLNSGNSDNSNDFPTLPIFPNYLNIGNIGSAGNIRTEKSEIYRILEMYKCFRYLERFRSLITWKFCICNSDSLSIHHILKLLHCIID